MLAVAGCGAIPNSNALLTSSTAVEAKGIVDTLARGDIDAVTSRLDPSKRTPDSPERVRQMAVMFPKTTPTRVRIVGAGYRITTRENDHATWEFDEFTIESNYATANLLSRVVFERRNGGERLVSALHTTLLPAPLEVLNAFTFGDKDLLNLVFLLAMVAVAGVMLRAATIWVRHRKSIRFRWLWAVGILLGACTITLNWTTGGMSFYPWNVKPIGFGCWRPHIDGPWMLSFAIPVGAIAFLIKHRRATPAVAADGAARPPLDAGTP
jgi:hypothetical protein